MNTKQDYIAVFDSGVGGISVLRHLRRLMPGERYLYFGDSANAPYGTKTKDEVEALTFAAARRLMERGVKALVVACNTATSAAIHDLREAYPDTIVIGIEPALKLAYDRYHGGGIGVMATPMTLREEKFEALMHRYDQSCRIYKIPAPGLVELVERGQADSPEAENLLWIALLRGLAAKLGIELVFLRMGKLLMRFSPYTKVDWQKLIDSLNRMKDTRLSLRQTRSETLLALNQMGMNDLDGARRSLRLYRRVDPDGEGGGLW